MDKLRSIQALRAVAVIAVVCCHAFASHRGSSGVDLFFVISGFIIARVSQGRSPGEFAMARVQRIYPVYLLTAMPYIVFGIAGGAGIGAVAATVTLWPVWQGQYHEPLLPVAWSLYFEMFFYAATALWLYNRHWARAAATLVILLALTRPSAVTGFLLSPIILEFGAGLILARVRRFPLAGLALAIGLIWLFAPDRAFEGATMLDPAQAGLRLLMYGIPAVLIVYGGLGLEHRFAATWADPLVRIGDASYSIYLTHLMPVHGLVGVSGQTKVLVALLLGLSAHEFVERPLGRWFARKRIRLRASPKQLVVT